MKLKINYIIALFLLFSAGCNHLDFDESGGEPKEFHYELFGNLKALAGYGYSQMYQDFNAALLACGTDDAEYTYLDAGIQRLNDGSWSAFHTFQPRWDESYKVITAMNDFLETFDLSRLDRYQYGQGYEDNMREARYWPIEARVLRAYHFFELAKRYGDIPMPLKVLEPEEANTIGKTPFDNVIAFIVSECNALFDSLPVRWDAPGLSQETGRFTKGAVMAMKTRALIFAASPLHNPTNSTDKWKEAAKAARDLIDSAFYSLEPISKNIFNTIESNSRELILTIRNRPSNNFERANFPIGYEGGNSGTTPTQNLVDAFQTINGYDVTLSSAGWVSDDPAFNPAAPYANRDPRFYHTLLHDNAFFKGRPVNVSRTGSDGPPIIGATRTGYYLRKYVQESVNLAPAVNSTAYHHWIVYRYADVLLSYAEAMNEAYGPEGLDGDFTLTALAALNQVRTRANMPAYAGLSQAELRETVRRERRVELAFEGHRFWDVRRWKIGEETQKVIHGVDIEIEDGNRVYSLKTVENRVWNDRMYLFPIPQQELYINRELGQNPGW